MKIPQRNHVKTSSAPSSIKIRKPNYHNMMLIVVFVVGGFLVYRMISSVQRQVLLMTKEMSNLKQDLQKLPAGHSPSTFPGFEVGFNPNDDDDDESGSVNSVEIENIMKKLSRPGQNEETDTIVSEGTEVEGAVAENDPVRFEDDHSASGSESGGDEYVEVEFETDENHKSEGQVEPSERIVEIGVDLKKKPVSELKQMLKDKGLPSNGKKAELIDALRKQ